MKGIFNKVRNFGRGTPQTPPPDAMAEAASKTKHAFQETWAHLLTQVSQGTLSTSDARAQLKGFKASLETAEYDACKAALKAASAQTPANRSAEQAAAGTPGTPSNPLPGSPAEAKAKPRAPKGMTPTTSPRSPDAPPSPPRSESPDSSKDKQPTPPPPPEPDKAPKTPEKETPKSDPEAPKVANPETPAATTPPPAPKAAATPSLKFGLRSVILLVAGIALTALAGFWLYVTLAHPQFAASVSSVRLLPECLAGATGVVGLSLAAGSFASAHSEAKALRVKA